MTLPIPDRSRTIFQQSRVRPAWGLRPRDAYDLTLFEEHGRPDRGVLLVTMVLQFKFKEAAGAHTPTWTDVERRRFALLFRDAITRTWDDRHRLSTTSYIPKVREVATVFDIRFLFEAFSTKENWTIEVTRIEEDFRSSMVNLFTGKVTSDSEDIRPVGKAGAPAGLLQRGAVHEFGHMLGLRDEYPRARDAARAWTGDTESVMHSGEAVRDRHYAPFAHWLTEQSRHMAELAREPIQWLVNGTLSAEQARL